MVGDGEHYVYLNLSGMDNTVDDGGFAVNRIALKAETISISTTKNVMAIPLPFSGIITGEAQTLGMDFGVSTKNISMSGILTEQVISKRFKTAPTGTNPSVSDGVITVTMTSHEIAQLIHSYVDSSFVQKHQNFASLIVLIPSRVGKTYQYHDAASAPTGSDTETTLPRIPFTFKTRGGSGSGLLSKEFDAAPLQRGVFPSEVTGSEIASLEGFVRSFNTTFQPGQPFIEYSLEFEIAITPG
jgi:hypothetical protein